MKTKKNDEFQTAIESNRNATLMLLVTAIFVTGISCYVTRTSWPIGCVILGFLLGVAVASLYHAHKMFELLSDLRDIANAMEEKKDTEE